MPDRMTTENIWPLVHAERRALAADLTGLAPERWQTPSLCSGWTVHDVLAHMVATAKLTPAAFLVRLAASSFSMSRFTDTQLAAQRLGRTRRHAGGLPGGRDVPVRTARTHAELAG